MNDVPKKRTTRRAVANEAIALPISEIKSKTTTKKVSAKKAVSPKKVVAKKTVAKAPQAKTTTRTRGIKSPLSDELMAEVTETNVDTETVKMVTGPLSPRLKEKLALYELWYRTKSSPYAEGVARVFGYSFIFVGFILAFALTTSDTLKDQGLMATLECSLSNCTDLTASSSVPAAPLSLPTVTFVTTPIIVDGKDTDMAFTITEATEHTFIITSHETGVSTTLPPAGNDGAGMYMYRIPTQELAPGDYEITVRATASDGTTKTAFAGGIITVPAMSVQAEVMPELEQTISTEDEVSTELPEADIETATSTEDVSVQDSTMSDVEVGQVLGLSTSSKEELSTTVDEPTEVLQVTETTDKTDAFSITVTPGILSNQYKVVIEPTYDYDSVELSIRALNATTPLYLGEATAVKAGWLYWLDASTLPAGTYRLIVAGAEEGDAKDRAEIRFVNTLPAPLYLTSPEYEEVKRALETDVITLSSATSSDLAAYLDPRADFVPDLVTGTLNLDEESRAAEIVDSYEAELNPLLRRYATARQSGNETALRLSETEIEHLITAILDSEVTVGDDSVFTLESEVRYIITTLKEKITSIENFKKERTAAASSIDTDEDGVTDYDEYLLYATDPKEADTDRDGVTDGVEISRGYDPKSTEPEAVMRFSEPETVSYVDDTVLNVTAITPLLVYEANEVEPLVQSEIIGYGLPNSFVTLFIYGEPIIQVVKTDGDGRFSSTLTKVLPDGVHDVYATLIDNTGAVVLRSPVFRFAKADTSYTYPKETTQAAAVVSVPDLFADSRTNNLVATMGVIAFGLILLLMALALRQDRLKPESVSTR